MTSEQFWITIGNARSVAKPGESIEKALTAELRQFPPSAIVEFHNIYRLYMDAADMPLVETAARLRNGYLSGDGWNYFRSGLVAAGRDAYFAAMRDPDSIATLGRDQKYFGDELAMYSPNDALKKLGLGDVYEAAKQAPLSETAANVLIAEIEFHPKIDDTDEALLPRLAAMRKSNIAEFEVELTNGSRDGYKTATAIELPATDYELRDAMERARIADDEWYSLGLLDCKHKFLSSYAHDCEDVRTLNALARKLSELEDFEVEIFKGMIAVDISRAENKTLSVERLLALATSTDCCVTAAGIADDEQVGRFMFENDMLSSEDYYWLESKIEQQRSSAAFAAVGAQYREDHGGAFTSFGYLEFDGTVNEFAASTAEPAQLIESNENGVCLDCAVPSAIAWLNTNRDPALADSFANALTEIAEHGKLREYKALLASEQCADLTTAVSFANEVHAYTLGSEQTVTPSEYAVNVISKMVRREYGERFNPGNLSELGETMMRLDGIAQTAYGELRRQNDAPIQLSFWQSELTKMFGSSEAIRGFRTTGNIAVGRLTDTESVRLQFVSTLENSNYDALEVAVINRREGVIDKTAFRFIDVIGKATVIGEDGKQSVIAPNIWDRSSGAEWFRYQPSDEDYAKIGETIDAYLEIFQEPTQSQNMTQYT